MTIEIDQLLLIAPLEAPTHGSSDPLEALRAAYARQCERAAILDVPPALWRALCAQQTLSLDEVLARLEREEHWEALSAMVDLISLDTLRRRARLPEAHFDEQRLVYVSARRLASEGAVEEATSMALRSAWSGALYAALAAVCDHCPERARATVVDVIVAKALDDDCAVSTRALCRALAFIEEPPRRAALYATAFARVEPLGPERVDAFDNPWLWLAQAAQRDPTLGDFGSLMDRARLWDPTGESLVSDDAPEAPSDVSPEDFGADLVSAARAFADEASSDHRARTREAIRRALEGPPHQGARCTLEEWRTSLEASGRFAPWPVTIALLGPSAVAAFARELDAR